MYYYIFGNMGMTSSGSFSKDKTRWIMFEQSEKDWLESTGRKPYSASRAGMFISVTKYA